jgi:antitoxin YefM
MQIINYSQARDQLKAVIDRVVEDADIAIISRRDGDDAVLMSKAMYESMQETIFLMSNPANVQHLAESIAQHKAGKAKRKTLADA